MKEVKKALINYLYPDKARDLIEGLEYGFELKYSGPRKPFEAKRTKAKKLLDITKILLSKKS